MHSCVSAGRCLRELVATVTSPEKGKEAVSARGIREVESRQSEGSESKRSWTRQLTRFFGWDSGKAAPRAAETRDGRPQQDAAPGIEPAEGRGLAHASGRQDQCDAIETIGGLHGGGWKRDRVIREMEGGFPAKGSWYAEM